MKLLMLCLRFPYPPSDGGTIAMYNMASALKKNGVQVKILTFNTKKHFVDPEKIPESFRNDFQPEAVYLDATVSPVNALLNLFGNKSYNITRFDIPEFHYLIEETLKKDNYDIIQMESLFVTPYIDTIKKHSGAKIVLRAHNVEYLIWERLVTSENSTLKKWYLKLLADRLKKYEMSVIRKLDAIIALTDDDKLLLAKAGNTSPVLVSPIGLDMDKYIVTETSSSTVSVFHLGSMDWMPNIEAVDWFLRNVYPLLNKNQVNVKIYLAGKSMPQHIFDQANDKLIVSGRVDDSGKFMSDKSIMIVPLLSGGGMRVKIIEGLAMGKTIISTTIGAEGIKYENGKNILIADTPEEFYNAIVKCISDVNFCRAIGKEARILAQSVYDNKVVGKQVIDFYDSIFDSVITEKIPG